MLNPTQINKVTKKFLVPFNNEKVVIDDNTILGTVLSETDGMGTSNSANIFKLSLLWTLRQAGAQTIKFPDSWLTSTVLNFSLKVTQTQ